MPAWLANILLNIIIPIIVAEFPQLEKDGLQALVSKYPALLPFLQALGLLPK